MRKLSLVIFNVGDFDNFEKSRTFSIRLQYYKIILLILYYRILLFPINLHKIHKLHQINCQVAFNIMNIENH